MGWIANVLALMTGKLNIVLARIAANQRDLDAKLNLIFEREAAILSLLKQILIQVSNPPVLAVMTLSRGENAMNEKATIDFQLLDNGTGVATLTLLDAAGLPANVPATSTVASTWTASASAVVVTPDATNPLKATFAPSVPPELATGVVLTASVSITDPALPAISLTATGQPIDVIAGDAASVTMVEAAN